MNEFEFTLKKEEIRKATTKAYLKKCIATYYSTANFNYKAHYYVDTYSKNSSIITMQTRLKAFELAKLAKDRYFELYESLKGLPDYAKTLTFQVQVRMTLEEAFEWVQSKKDV